MAKHGKRYRDSSTRSTASTQYSPAEAVALIKELRPGASSTRPSSATSAPGSTSATPTSSCAARSRCPHGLGKEMTVAVFAKGDKAREAQEAGADHVGDEDLAQEGRGGLHRLRRRDRDART